MTLDQCKNPKDRKSIMVLLKGEKKQQELIVEEYHPYEPSAYQWDSGWTCYDSEENEYFVSESGSVWKQPENEEVGVVPEIIRYLNEMEQRWERQYIG